MCSLPESDTLSLPKGWVEENLVSCLEKVIDYRGKTPKKSDSGILTLSAKSVKMGEIDYSKAYYISKETYDKFMVRGFPQKGDVLMTTEAPLGCIAKLDRDDVSVAQRLLTLRGKEGVLDNNYLMFYLTSRRGQHELQSRASGSTVQGIKRSEFEYVQIVLPPFPEQKAIADMLSSFDEKIELLREQNKILETLAQTIFKEWFVNFNYPDLSACGHAQADATGEMVDSLSACDAQAGELGEIPKGWQVGKLGDVIKTNGSSISKNSELDVIQYLDTGSLTEGHIESTQELHLADAPSRARRIVQHNDVLISTVRPNLKHYGIIKEPDENLIVSTGFCVITCDEIDPHFVYYLLTTNEMTDYLHSVAEGSTSTYPSIKPSDIEKVEFVLPPENFLKLFSEYADKAWNKIMFNQEQIKDLSNPNNS